jgi:hypothetical protein
MHRETKSRGSYFNMLKINPKHNTNVLKKQKILVVEEQQELVQDEAAANRHEFERLELGPQLPLKGAAGERDKGDESLRETERAAARIRRKQLPC